MTGLLLVAAGGAAGAAARFVLDGVIRSRHHGAFPWGTFVVNVLGSLIIGFVAGFVLFGGHTADAVEPSRLALATGLCGGFTTFSTAMVEVVRLARSNRVRLALVSTIGTLVTTVAAVAAGIAVVGVIV
ncbi:fluoride efflux transporter FluC [Myceligenerans pegani]|uniref:Fluoride-specific ion channel FluC n=1 Tax=Myceligenerans pegani TaxID=2776917 RepID=A0ABR9N3W4_9MICO|nr:CrcB family protein [Myceligenerans sp. TRM 65318]MBE1877961.1 CrcB family protein [Myceligenerans sp. TRM 65318]MBE3020232.1 CrcB family protein [Myceligenerans sp. TRM 65318]